MRETQTTISQWANETFGPVGSNVRVAARANEEMAELLRALSANDEHPKAIEEVADVVIVLYRLADRLGEDLHTEVERKMAINRGRRWKLSGEGHGYHVRDRNHAAADARVARVSNDMTGATVTILASHSLSVALFVFGAAFGIGPVMNACWVAAIACLYAPIGLAMRAFQMRSL